MSNALSRKKDQASGSEVLHGGGFGQDVAPPRWGMRWWLLGLIGLSWWFDSAAWGQPGEGSNGVSDASAPPAPEVGDWWEDLLQEGILPRQLSLEERALTKEELRAGDALLEQSAPAGALVQSEEEQRAALAQRQALGLVRAIFARDAAELQRLLQAGASPNQTTPHEIPRDLLAQVQGEALHYYLTSEGNFTVLMLAAAMGYREGVEILLAAGADRWATTRRHKTYALWLAARTGDVPLMRLLMALDPQGAWQRHTVQVDLTAQEMTLYREGEEVLRSPISSGKKSKPTPSGQFIVTDKHRDWESSIYRVPMPHFVRLSCSDFGFHAGRLPGYPASSGCIRLPPAKAKEFFEMVPVGTLVVIQ